MLVRVLGPTVLESDAGPRSIGSRAIRSLLAVLAVHAGSTVSADALTSWVWGEDDLPEHPVPALHTIVSRLRRTLSDAGRAATLETAPGGYALRMPREDVDAVRFEALIRQARELSRHGDASGAVAIFESGLALWSGDQALIDVCPNQASRAHAVRLEELRLTATQDRIDLLLTLRPPGELVDELASLTGRYPLREGFARQYMAALDSCGERAKALEVYRRLAHTMRHELGIDPTAITREAHADLLAERRPDGRRGDVAGAAVSVKWPVLVGTPPDLAAAFQMRVEPRTRVCAEFVADPRAVVVTQVMAGDGGVGKTQLAADLFYEAVDEGGVDLGVWVTATSRDAVLAGYAAAYKITHPDGAVHREIEAGAAAFLAWLADTDRTWMVVLDDVADPADLNQLRPRGRSGRVLVTTRRRDAAMTAIGSIVDVGLFTPPESLAYLQTRLSHTQLAPTVVDEAQELAEDLGHLPLALAQSAAVVINDGITCAEYRAQLADRTLSLAEVFPLDPRASGDYYTHALPAAWSLATERAATAEPCVKQMLALVAVLDPNGIPETVLLAPAVAAYLGVADDPSAGARLARSGIRAAHRFSLLTHTPTDPTRSVRMHALAQRAALESLHVADLSQLVRVAADALVQVWPEIASDRDLAQVLRTNTTTLNARHPDALWQPAPHPVLFRAGWNLALVGQMDTAIAYYADLIERLQNKLGPDHPSTLSARHQLVECRARAGDTARAVTDLESVLADQLRVLGPDHRDTFVTRYDLADRRGTLGDAHGAAMELEVLTAETGRVLGPDDFDTLGARHDWAYWRGEAGDRQSALRAFEELLVDTTRVYGPDHQFTLGTRHYLARERGLVGDPGGAAQELEALLGDAVRVLGPDNPYTLLARQSLAEWRGRAGNPRAARADLGALLPDMLRVLGADHVETLTTRHAMARWEGECGDTAAAVSGFRDLLADALRTLSPDSPLVVTTQESLDQWGTTARGIPPEDRLLVLESAPDRNGPTPPAVASNQT